MHVWRTFIVAASAAAALAVGLGAQAGPSYDGSLMALLNPSPADPG